MSDYQNYSSDDGSSDDIGIPKTPGAPLQNQFNDSEESNDSKSSASSLSSSENKNKKKNIEKDYSNDESNKNSGSDGDDNKDSDENKNSNDDSNDGSVNQGKKESEMKKKLKRQFMELNQESEDDSSNISFEDEYNKKTKKQKTMLDSSEDSDNNSDNNKKRVNTSKAEELFGEVSDDEDERNKKDSDVEDSANRLINDDNEDDNSQEHEVTANEIFGDDDKENGEMDEEISIPETRINVEIPRIVADLGDGIHFVKLPNFLSIDTHPYDPQWYEDEIDEDEVHDDEGRARLKLKVENTIRWRNMTDEDGNTVKQSNARVVKWSDGSMSLHLGDEIFDIQTLNLLLGENNHLFIRQGTGLQGQSVFKTKLTFRPFSTESFTHRKLTLSLADRSQKTQKICVLPDVGYDPEVHRSKMIKEEEDKLKASIRKENKQRRIKDRTYTRGPSSSYLEDEDDESISISKIKNKYKRGPAYSNSQYSDDEANSDDVDFNDDEEDEDSDENIFNTKKSAEKRKIVESDED